MALTYSDYISYIKNNNEFTHICKIQILDNNENVLEEITDNIISGDLTLTNQFGSRRNANLVLENTSGKFIPTYRGTLFLNKKCRLFIGIKINNEDFLINQGIFVISEVQAISNFAEKTVNITLLDKFSLLDGEIAGTLKADYIIPVSSSIDSVVRSILTEAGEIRNAIITPTGITTYYTITQSQGSSLSEILKQLADMISYDCYFDVNGYLRFEPAVIDYLTGTSLKASVFDYTTEEPFYLGVNHRYKFDSVKNEVWVYGTNLQGSTVSGTASDTNPFSTTRVSLIGSRTKVIQDSNIYSTDLATQRSRYELFLAINLQESCDLSSVPIIFLKENDIITITDLSAGLNRDRCLINSIRIPFLCNGIMSLNCWKIRSF